MRNNLRVLEAVNSYLPSTENWIYRLIGNLPDTDIVIASKRFLKCNFYASDFSYLEFPLKRIETNDITFSVYLFNKLVALALRILYYPYITKYAGKIDLIHSHFASAGWEYLSLAKKLKKPHVVSFYGRDYEALPFAHPTWKKRYERLFREADLFLCEGSFGAGVLQRMGCPENKIRVQRLGVDVDSIPFLTREKQSEELNLVQIATFTEKKGHIYTIKAFVKALESCPNMSLTFVGKDIRGIKGEIQTIIHQCRMEDKVAFLDWIDFGDLHVFMEDYHVFIHPSCHTATRDCEGGAPVVLLDAQATGMPIIATTHCDCPDEVIHNETGLLTPEKDTDSLADSIRYFYGLDNSKYRAFCVKAREHISRNFDCKQNAAQLKKIYTACVEEWRLNN
jgi:colanic acid/amylovoran biosynthesis glycosyltransferase